MVVLGSLNNERLGSDSSAWIGDNVSDIYNKIEIQI